MTADDVMAALTAFADAKRAESSTRYFKTYADGYGAGDQFLGLTVPAVRAIAKRYKTLPPAEVGQLLDSPIHEHRQAGLMIMVEQAKKASAAQRQALHDLYIRKIDRVNNWDLVDGSAPAVIGAYLLDKPRDALYDMARSDDIWERRIAIIATFAFFKAGQFDDTLAIAELLLQDDQDLIHKAVGWSLREVGKRDRALLTSFLDKHAYNMPRTALRYAIEHFSPPDREHYMKAKSR